MNIFNLGLVAQMVVLIVVGGYLQIMLAFVGSQIPAERFSPNKFPYKLFEWEKNGAIYQKALIKLWKPYLPDAAEFVQGEFRKKHLASTEESYLRTFIVESCRVEWVHWIAMASFLVFILLLSFYLALLAQVYAVAVNLPCIFAQRYNRPRIERFLVRAKRVEKARLATTNIDIS